MEGSVPNTAARRVHLSAARACRTLTAATLVLVLLAAVAAPARGQTTFVVTVVSKSEGHPNPGGGIGQAYAVDGVEGAVLRLERGQTYTFQMQSVPTSHPFYLSTSAEGGGAEVFEDGVTGTFATGDATLTIEVDDDTPDLLYYQCQFHTFMGWRIYVTDPGPAPVELRLVADGLAAPIELVESPDGTGRRFVADQTGQIYVIGADGTMNETPFLDLSDRMVALNAGYDERGLLGLAFHPDYAQNGTFYVYYSAPLRDGAPSGFNHTSHLSSFTVSGDPDVADPASETVLLAVDQPQGNHNAGQLAFGPDGNLYVSLGDGGGADDTGTGHEDDWYAENDGGNGQNVTANLLGTIVRLDVDGGDPYAIPADNPFVGTDGLDEIYAYGFRNPWRFSFDQEWGLLVSDAGQNLWEEVSRVERGGNYGWNVREGTHCFSTANPDVSPATCPDVVSGDHPDDGAPLVDPVIEYGHPGGTGIVGLVVVGGHVYRGADVPQLAGRYVFADWSDSFGAANAQLLMATPRADGLWAFEQLPVAGTEDGRLDAFVLAFGEDADGELYVLTSNTLGPDGTTGAVWRLDAEDDTAVDETPRPSGFALAPAYPNPFRAETSVDVRLDAPGAVTLAVYDVLGRRVATLHDGALSAGTHRLTWDGRGDDGRPAASGSYLLVLRTPEATKVQAAVLAR